MVMMITLEGVQETHLRMAYCRIYQLIYPRHRERIFGAGLVKVCEVYVDAPFPCLLLHHYCISQPLGVEIFNCPCLFEFNHLSLYCLHVFTRGAPRRLLFWSS